MTKEEPMKVEEVNVKKEKEGDSEKSVKISSPSHSSKDNRRRVHIENLHKDINNRQLYDLLSKYGKLLRCGIHFDKLGNSTGKADVEFSTHEGSEAAIKDLDQVEIKGEKMTVKYSTFSGRPFITVRKIVYIKKNRKNNKTIGKKSHFKNYRKGRRINYKLMKRSRY